MEITHEQRKQRREKLPLEIQEFYGSVELARHIKAVRDTYGIPEDSRFIDAIGDVILGFYSISELPHLLKNRLNVGDSTAIRITSDLIDFIPLEYQESQQHDAAGTVSDTSEKIDPNDVNTATVSPQPTRPGLEPITASDRQMLHDRPYPENTPQPQQHTAPTPPPSNSTDTTDTAPTDQNQPVAPPAAHQADVPHNPQHEPIQQPPTIEPVHTLEQDIDKIHGYGAYRKMYPETQNGQEETTQADRAASQEIRNATPQNEVLGNSQLSHPPSYTDDPRNG